MIKQQFLKFIIVGVFTTIVNYLSFYIAYKFIGLHYILASTIGFFLGVLSGYGFNKSWTFNVTKKAKQFVYKYYLVYGISLIISIFSLKLLVTILHILPELANVITIGITTCTNFIGTKFWVFKDEANQE